MTIYNLYIIYKAQDENHMKYTLYLVIIEE